LKTGLIAIASSLLCLLAAGCAPSQDFGGRLDAIASPHRFSTVRWEATAIPHEAKQLAWGIVTDGDADSVREYFAATERIKSLEAALRADADPDNTARWKAELAALLEYRATLKDGVERTLEGQVKQALAGQGILNPLDRYIRLGINIPPLNFKLEQPPHLLVVSPRHSITSLERIYLKQDITLAEMEAIEAAVDEMGVSSLVVELGGLAATYPSFVTDDASLEFTIETAAEEWLHQYLVFKPLGFLYLLDHLGATIEYDVITMNETVASMASEEIAALVMESYYPELLNDENDGNGFDFNAEMRHIRRTVDNLLAEGRIDEAEGFMEQRRQYLSENGYYIRKLNQAYFAFHGTYADDPTSIDPIGDELKQLRARSASLKDFLDRAGALTSREELRISVE